LGTFVPVERMFPASVTGMRTTGMGIHVVPSLVWLSAELVPIPGWFIFGAILAPATPGSQWLLNSSTSTQPLSGWNCVSRVWMDLCPVRTVACASAQKLCCAVVMWLGAAQFGGWGAGCGCVCGLCTLPEASSL
jgi:hypothetical protein